MTTSELPPARGRGAEHFDVPTRFYLSHRQDIERWAALRKRASDATHQLHVDLEDEIAEQAALAGLAAGLFRTGSNYRCWLLALPGVPQGADKSPVAAIGIRWHRLDTLVDDEKAAARVGVRVSDSSIRERFLALDGGLRPVRDAHRYKSDTRWPAYRPVTGHSAWWAELDTYVQRLLDELSETVTLFSRHLARV